MECYGCPFTGKDWSTGFPQERCFSRQLPPEECHNVRGERVDVASDNHIHAFVNTRANFISLVSDYKTVTARINACLHGYLQDDSHFKSTLIYTHTLVTCVILNFGME